MNSNLVIYGAPILTLILAAIWVMYLNKLCNDSKRNIERACKDPRYSIMAEIYKHSQSKKGKAP